MSNEQRPTSKPRGICKYYTTPRGCFGGSKCKFLHGEEDKLTPYDQRKTCKFYAAGYCRRGGDCWFVHSDPDASKSSADAVQSTSKVVEEEDRLCSICLEKPITYGLLVGCDHIFCLECIRRWRNSEGKSSDVVISKVNKSCPLCRVSSQFVTPSSHFYPSTHPGKASTIEQYKASMARVPCRYFQASLKTADRFCPFGKDCFYQHKNEDGTDYVFEEGVEHYIKMRPRLRAGAARGAFSFTENDSLSESPWVEELSAALEAIRISLPAFLQQPGDEVEEEDDGGDPMLDDQAPPREFLQQLTNEPLERLLIETLEFLGIEDHAPETRPEAPLYRFGTITPSFTARPRIVYSDPGSPVRAFDLIPVGEYDDFDTIVTHRRYDAEVPTTTLPEGVTSSVALSELDAGPNNAHESLHDTLIEDSSLARPVETDEQRQLPSGLPSEPAVDDWSSSAHQLPDPPLLTDGRGRVVWSSMSASRSRRGRTSTSASHRKSQRREFPGDRAFSDSTSHSADSIAPCPSPPAPLLSLAEEPETMQPSFPVEDMVTDGRGRVIFAAGASQSSDTGMAAPVYPDA
ncbi:unnamed protein product [Somion occarium]|uniref:RING-type E3 ubiquitin transferase n=1 Tax=Somion occarium TaxID=3059160 RepID=A0ABP1E666_9APHY